jgi:hypothetical protein
LTYCLYDSNGYVGDLASIGGLKDLRDFVLHKTNDKNIRSFFDKGHITPTPALITRIKGLHSDNESINTTLTNLVDLLSKCDTVAIISDGVS